MRRGLLTLICTGVMVGSIFAQPNQADRAKYELIRETINFLATDKTVSKDTNFRVSCEALDYDCFQQQLASEPIAGIERWYNAWRAMKATDEAGLTALRKQIFADIFERPGKGYRKQLAAYQSYVDGTESLLHLSMAETPSEQVPVTHSPMDSGEAPLEHPESANVIYPELTNEEVETPENENPMIAYLALALAIVALVFSRLKKAAPQPTADIQMLHERLDELMLRMKQLEQRLADGQMDAEAVASLTEIMESVERRVAELERRN